MRISMMLFCLTATALTALSAHAAEEVSYICDVKGEALDAVQAQMRVSVKDVSYSSGQRGTFLVFKYTAPGDRVYTARETSVPVKDISTEYKLKLSDANTKEEYRMSLWDGAYLEINQIPIPTIVLSKGRKASDLAILKGKKEGYVGEAHLRNGTRSLTGQAICIRMENRRGN